ncbi:WhiB family transcriptional regulator [Streptodolium elevatio]
MGDSMRWMVLAACRSAEPGIFEDTETSGPREQRAVDAALRVCGACTVRTRCLEWALATEQPQGIWGGHTTPQRRALLRARTRPRIARRVVRAA